MLSIAAGVTTHTIRQATGDGVAVLRTMPNTPALVGEGVSALSGSPGTSADDLDWAERILAGVGLVVRVDEAQLDAVTGLTGSGPAYVFLVAEALIDAGVAGGLAPDIVEAMVAQLLVGSSKLLAERGDPAGLRAMVTSPGGTTAAGIRVLEARARPGGAGRRRRGGDRTQPRARPLSPLADSDRAPRSSPRSIDSGRRTPTVRSHAGRPPVEERTTISM